MLFRSASRVALLARGVVGLNSDGNDGGIRRGTMVYWIHIARAIDRVTLHRDRCSEVPSSVSSSDFWEGGWFDYPDKERALAAMEVAGTSDERKCALCKP